MRRGGRCRNGAKLTCERETSWAWCWSRLGCTSQGCGYSDIAGAYARGGRRIQRGERLAFERRAVGRARRGGSGVRPTRSGTRGRSQRGAMCGAVLGAARRAAARGGRWSGASRSSDVALRLSRTKEHISECFGDATENTCPARTAVSATSSSTQ